MTGQRDLRSVSTDRVVGAVRAGQDHGTFTGAAAGVFRVMRERLGDDAAARLLVEDGWSNGYLYLGSAI